MELVQLPSAERAGVPERRLVEGPVRVHTVGAIERRFSTPITFTPFASARPCSARCVFCSETLEAPGSGRLSASLRPSGWYLDALARALSELRGLRMGLSLSGLEATDDPDWLLGVLAEIERHLGEGGELDERVLYSNAAGLAGDRAGELLSALEALSLTRVEASRHHWDEARNDAIMRFRPGVSVRNQPSFERAVRAALLRVPVRLVCLVQRGGVESLADAERYLGWASGLGVTDVVFREASRLPVAYERGRTLRRIEASRVSIDALLDQALSSPRWRPEERTVGYYYANLRFRVGAQSVTLEASDYGAMKAAHGSGVVHKLVFHANGNLCGDWDPEREVLLRAAPS